MRALVGTLYLPEGANKSVMAESQGAVLFSLVAIIPDEQAVTLFKLIELLKLGVSGQ